jgi:hypothetical protein
MAWELDRTARRYARTPSNLIGLEDERRGRWFDLTVARAADRYREMLRHDVISTAQDSTAAMLLLIHEEM